MKTFLETSKHGRYSITNMNTISHYQSQYLEVDDILYRY